MPIPPHPFAFIRPRGIPRWITCLALLLLPLMTSGVQPAAAQEPACTTSGPDSGQYSVRVCLTGLADGATLAGDVEVTATVEPVSGTPPDVKYVQFFFSRQEADKDAAVLRDVTAPYTFTLPTARWADQAYRLGVEVMFTDTFKTPVTSVGVTTTNGVTRIPRSTGRWEPKSVTGKDSVVVAAVGDGAAGETEAEQVASLVEGWNPDLFLYLGDVYNSGSYTEFLNFYDPTFGKMKAITDPITGDHEGGRQFQGFLDYWDTNQFYYRVTAGAWTLYAIDTTEKFGETAPGTAQFEWLRNQLANEDNGACTIVFMHDPRWGLTKAGDNDYLADLWSLYAEGGVDIVVSASEHNYQRWMPLNAAGQPTDGAPTEFVVGTGGFEPTQFGEQDDRVVAQANSSGALRLDLTAGQAGFQFVDTTGAVLDQGSVGCNGASAVARHEAVRSGRGEVGAMPAALVDTSAAGRTRRRAGARR